MITRKQYNFLKKISKNEIPCDDLIENRDIIFLYLLNQNFIEKYLVCPDNDIYEKNAKSYCQTSEKGEVELKLYRQENYRFWVPTIISIIALITSILSICNAPIVWTYVQETFVQSDEEDQ